MRTQRFRTLAAPGPGGSATIVVPFDPDELWGAKAEHHVNGTVDGRRVHVRLSRAAAGGRSPWARRGCIDATTRRPELRAARIAKVVDLLAAGIKERPRS